MEETQEHPPRARRARRRIVTTIVGGVAAGALTLGLTVAALTAAGAQTSSPSGRATKVPVERAWPGDKVPVEGAWPGDGMRGPGPMDGPGPGRMRVRVPALAGGGIHGEFTTKKPGGGYQTLAMQTGEVTSVSSSSIAVKSEDGFTRTYSVDDKTRVMAGKEGIGGVKKGDTVRVLAVVEDGKARSLHVVDLSNLKELRSKKEGRPENDELRNRLKQARPEIEGS
jgi:hypothetical protein